MWLPLAVVKYFLSGIKRSGRNRKRSIFEIRKEHNEVLARFHITRDVSWKDEVTPLGRWRWFFPKKQTHEMILLHFHGGTLCMGGIESHSHFVSHLAKTTGCTVLLPEYRLAPEHPYPASFEDALSLYRYMIEELKIPSHQIVISADSGGGLLAFSLIHRCHRLLLPTPRMLLLFAPATSVEVLDQDDLYADLNARDTLLDVEQIRRYCRGIFGNHPTDDPLISPMYGDYTAFPPFFSVIGAEELLLESLRMVHVKAVKAGVDCRLMVQEGCFHAHYLFPTLLREAQVALDAAAQFLHARVHEKALEEAHQETV